MVLPKIYLSDVDGNDLGTLDGELRLSVLGNHYVRLEAHRHGLSPHDVAFAVFRAAPEHGTIRVRLGEDEDAPHWNRLSDLAVDLVQALPTHLSQPRQPSKASHPGHHGADRDDGRGSADGAQVHVSVRPGMYHVLVTVHEATLGVGPAAPAQSRRQAQSAAEVVGAVGGPVLLHPALNGIGSIVEWIRYPPCVIDKPSVIDQPTGIDKASGLGTGAIRVPELAEVVRGVGRQGDLIARTCNTTLIVMLGTPSWLIGMHETVAEFVASLDGLFGAWFDELASHHRTAMELLSGLDHGEQSLPRLTSDAESLQREQLRLHDFAAGARSIQALIRSPALVAAPLDAATLRYLLDTAGFDRVEKDFAAKVGELLDDRLGTRIEALAARRQQEADRVAAKHERDSRARMDTLLAVIAAAGVSGVVQILQAGLGWGAGEAMTAAGFVVVAAAGLGVWVWSSVRQKAR